MILRKDNLIKAYNDGMLLVAYGMNFVYDKVSEQQIEMIKEFASKLKEAEIDQSMLPCNEKVNEKRQWKLWRDATINGVKDGLRNEGRLV